MKTTSLGLIGRLLCGASILLFSALAVADCVPSGNDNDINSALGQEGASVELCSGSTFYLKKSILLKEGQELSTEKKSRRRVLAKLVVVGEELATAIQSQASNIRIHDLYIDGQRQQLGRLPKGGALIEVGGAGSHDIHIDHVRALDPRGWSTLHAFEGRLDCSGVTIEDNHFGPAGTPDGQWADGISLACRDSLVRRNVVEDASDGAIVIFGAPGSIIENNKIVTNKNTLLGGINLVDYKPYGGDYTGTRVLNNEIVGRGGFIKIGIAIGPSVWGGNNRDFIRGAIIAGNVIRGGHVGYGIAADGAEDIEISGNSVRSKFGGRTSEKCYKNTPFPQGSMVFNPQRVTGKIDEKMTPAALRYLLCIEAS